MSININGYCIQIEVQRNDRSAGYNSNTRRVAVDKGNVEINSIVEEMIEELIKSEKPL